MPKWRALIFDRPPVDLSKHEFKKLPGAIEIAAMYPSHFNF
jgi:hypothetical protein